MHTVKAWGSSGPLERASRTMVSGDGSGRGHRARRTQRPVEIETVAVLPNEERSEPKTFDFSVSDYVGTITLNRPDRLNALTFESYEELRDFFASLNQREDIRALVIHGTGRAFCSGGDVEDIIGELFSRDMKGLLAFTRVTGALIQNIGGSKCPSSRPSMGWPSGRVPSLRRRAIFGLQGRGQSSASFSRRLAYAARIWAQLTCSLAS